MNLCISTVLDETYPYWMHIIYSFRPEKVFHIDNFPQDLKRKNTLEAIKIKNAEEIEGPVIVVSPQVSTFYPGKTSLSDFQHPETCTYLFGDDKNPLGNLEELGKKKPEDIVYIPLDVEIHAHVAAGIVFWDRRTKCRME